ncbi:hypothetical protein [Pseudomonas sp.]|nr:hypothetical protein [Pseudomonas sp.]
MKRTWTITVGTRSFSMVMLEQALDHAGALREAWMIWPACEVAA